MVFWNDSLQLEKNDWWMNKKRRNPAGTLIKRKFFFVFFWQKTILLSIFGYFVPSGLSQQKYKPRYFAVNLLFINRKVAIQPSLKICRYLQRKWLRKTRLNISIKKIWRFCRIKVRCQEHNSIVCNCTFFNETKNVALDLNQENFSCSLGKISFWISKMKWTG